MDSPFIAVLVTIIGGVAVLAIWNARRSVIRALQKVLRRTWRLFSWPVHRWLGWLLGMSYTSDTLWASSDQFNGVQEGEFVAVRAIVNSEVSDWKGDGIQHGWQLDINVGADRIVCFFPKGYKKSNGRYLRRLKGSQRVVVHGKVTSLTGINSIYKNDWLKPTMNICYIVGAWKVVDRRQWLRVAGWREAQLVLGGSSSPLSRWSRLGRWLGTLR